MSRPPLEVADLIRSEGAAFIERNRQWIRWKHVKVLLAIARCRTAALGGHVDQCSRCGHRASISYNSCRNRHCPKCQTAARDCWIAARQKELFPTRYVHVVFTLPAQLAPLARQNRKFIYGLLLRASAETLLEVARDPRHLGAEIGFFSVLHTWNQKLQLHPHVHCVIPAGGLSLDHTHWIKSRSRFFLPIQVLRRVFRGKFVAGLKQAFQDRCLSFHPGKIISAVRYLRNDDFAANCFGSHGLVTTSMDGTNPRLSYCASIHLSEPTSLTDTFEKKIRAGLPSAVPRWSVETSRGPAFL